MKRLAQMKRVIFLGQQVASENFYGTLDGISMDKRIEMPVAEDMQVGMSIGMALEGFLPVCIIQRMDFLPRAADQIINHLGLIPELSGGLVSPKVIIRTTVGTRKPIDVGLQHSKNLTAMFRAAVSFPVLPVRNVKEVREAYNLAINGKKPVMIIEYQELYEGGDKK